HVVTARVVVIIVAAAMVVIATTPVRSMTVVILTVTPVTTLLRGECIELETLGESGGEAFCDRG
nr:hypothetical protein [Tanacetum cinerariifolium]